MKKLFLTFALLFTGLLFARETEWLISGSYTFSALIEKEENTKGNILTNGGTISLNTNINSSRFGYFIDMNFSVPFAYGLTSNEYNIRMDLNNFDMFLDFHMAEGLNYFLPISQRCTLIYNLGLDYNMISYIYKPSAIGVISCTLGLMVGSDILFFFNDNLALDIAARVGYDFLPVYREVMTGSGSTKINNHNSLISARMRLGLTYRFKTNI